MSLLADQIQSDLETVFFNTDDFAETVIYTPASSGVPKAIRAIINYGDAGGLQYESAALPSDGYTVVLTCERNSRPDFVNGQTRQTAYVMIMLSDIPVPKYRDTIELADGTTWKVVEIYND